MHMGWTRLDPEVLFQVQGGATTRIESTKEQASVIHAHAEALVEDKGT